MSTVVEPAKAERPWEADPWRYGWRYLDEEMPDGTIRTKRIPLTEEDVLHPKEGDFIMANPAYEQDCEVLKLALQSRLQDRHEVIVLRDCLVDWGVAGMEPLSPDAVVLEGVGDWNPALGIFPVAEHHARPVLVIEVTSPSTRNNDLGPKVDEYYRAGVPLYVIVDARVVDEVRTIRFIARQATEAGYAFMPLDARGWLWVEPVGLWLGTENGQLVCTDAQGRRLGVYLDTVREVETAQREVAAAQEQAAAEKARADALQQQLLQLQAELQKRGNPPT